MGVEESFNITGQMVLGRFIYEFDRYKPGKFGRYGVVGSLGFGQFSPENENSTFGLNIRGGVIADLGRKITGSFNASFLTLNDPFYNFGTLSIGLKYQP